MSPETTIVTCCATTGIEGKRGLEGNIHGWNIEGLEHYLGHLIPVNLGVVNRICQQHRVLVRWYTELIVERALVEK